MGRHFDPDIVRAFLQNEDRFVEILNQFAAREEFESSSLLKSRAEMALVS
jgi:HD-GYP domain-containing protein (c-di-GMP phosphodiesterase class II)